MESKEFIDKFKKLGQAIKERDIIRKDGFLQVFEPKKIEELVYVETENTTEEQDNEILKLCPDADLVEDGLILFTRPYDDELLIQIDKIARIKSVIISLKMDRKHITIDKIKI